MGGNCGSETHLIAIGRSHTVGGVGTHIVCGVGCKSREAASETACTAAVGSVAVGGSRSR